MWASKSLLHKPGAQPMKDCSQARLSDSDVFHPKVWILRFTGPGESVRYRVICLPRNITFDHCWDAAVSLDGTLTDLELAISDNHPLGDFVANLPRLAQRELPESRKRTIAKVAEDPDHEWHEGRTRAEGNGRTTRRRRKDNCNSLFSGRCASHRDSQTGAPARGRCSLRVLQSRLCRARPAHKRRLIGASEGLFLRACKKSRLS